MRRIEGRFRMKATIALICCLVLIPLGPVGVTGRQQEDGPAQVSTAPSSFADLNSSELAATNPSADGQWTQSLSFGEMVTSLAITPSAPQVIYADTEGSGVDSIISPSTSIAFAPSTLTFSCNRGQANPSPQTLEVWNGGGGTLNWTVSEDASWLSLSPTSGSSTGEHNTITLSINSLGLVTRTYTATLTLGASGADNTPQQIPITLNVQEPLPRIAFTPSSFSFSCTRGQANPPAQTFLQMGASDPSVSLNKVAEFNIHGGSVLQLVPFQGSLLARTDKGRIVQWDENINKWNLYPDVPSSIDECLPVSRADDFPGIALINGELFALYSKWNSDYSQSGVIYDCKTKGHIHLPVVRYRYGEFWISEQAIYITSDGNGHSAGGEGGEGVFVSYDHGQSWQPMNQGLTNLSIFGIEADPFGNMYCYGEGGFYRWQGSYWEKLIDIPYIGDVEFVATSSSPSNLVVYAANGGNLYVLIDRTVQTYPFGDLSANGRLFVDLESGTLNVAHWTGGVSTWNLADLNSRQVFFSGEVWASAVYRKGPYLYAGLMSGYEGARKIDTRTGQFQLMNQGLPGYGGINSGLLWQNNVYFGLGTMGVLQYDLSAGSAQMRYFNNPTSIGPPGEICQILEHDRIFYLANVDRTVYKTTDFQQFQPIHEGDYSSGYTSFSLYIDAQDRLFITPIWNTTGVFLCLDLQGNLLYKAEGLPETKFAWRVWHVVMENEQDMALVLAPLSKVGEKYDIYLSHDAGQHWSFFREGLGFNAPISSYHDKLILCQENGTFFVDPSDGSQQKISDMSFNKMFVKDQYLFGTLNGERLVMIDLGSGNVIEDLNLGDYGFPVELNATGNRILLSTDSSRNFVFEIVEPPPLPTLEVWNVGGSTLNWTASEGAGWLSLVPTAGSSTGEHDPVTVSVEASGLVAGTYTTTITLAATGADNSPQQVPVTLIIEPQPPGIGFAPGLFTFTPTAGEDNPADQTLSLWNSGEAPLNWTVAESEDWLTLLPTGGTNDGSVAVGTNTAGLAAGTYSATITVTAPGAGNSPQQIPVTLTLVPATITLNFDHVAGWNMISLPVTPASSIPSVVFGGLPPGWVMYAWDAANGRYIGKEQIVLGLTAGYWLKVSTAIFYPVTGQPNGAAQTGIDLGLGWNLIGVPYEGAIPWGAVRASKDGGTLVMLDQAITSNWIQAMLFRWQGNAYQGLTTGGNFQPLSGYWIKTKVTGVRLVFLQP